MRVLSIYVIITIIAICNAIVKWEEKPLKQEMLDGSIVGRYDDIIYGLSPWKQNNDGTIKMNVSNGDITSFTYPKLDNNYDIFDGFGAPNSFVTMNENIYFISNDDGSCSNEGICESDVETHINSFSMETETFHSKSKSIPIGHFDGKSLPCLTSLTTKIYYKGKHQEAHYLIIMGGNGDYNCGDDDDYSNNNQCDDKTSNIVMFYHLETGYKFCKRMNAPSRNFGCKKASDGFLYKFGGDICQQHSSSSSSSDSSSGDGSSGDSPSHAQQSRLDLNKFDGTPNSINDKNWENVKVDLPQNLENPTILELKQVLYVIGGYDHIRQKCTKDVYYLDTNTQHPNGHKASQSLIAAHCFEAGIEINDQFYLFDGSELQSTANINSSSPTVSPSNKPSNSPTDKPSDKPSDAPTNKPSISPTDKPSKTPTNKPSNSPTNKPSISPTNKPSISPTNKPSISPTDKPSNSPTNKPSTSPTDKPSVSPSDSPSNKLSNSPSSSPSVEPTGEPTESPTISAPKSTQDSNTTNWVIIGVSIGCAVLLILVGVYCIIKRHKSRMNDQPLL